MPKHLNDPGVIINELEVLINEFKREIEALKQIIEIAEKRQKENDEGQIRREYEEKRSKFFKLTA
ncbi:MAG: hypothetical protein QXX08_01705 [Candidatus Bathyarchaeia archaeon]